MTKQEKLQIALAAREDEVQTYQINIDNYMLAIAHIDTLSSVDQDDLAEFKQRLMQLLKSEILEQKKSKVMLAVLKQQLE